MTTLALAHPIVTPSSRQLGAVEARRMVRHPAYLAAALTQVDLRRRAIAPGERGVLCRGSQLFRGRPWVLRKGEDAETRPAGLKARRRAADHPVR